MSYKISGDTILDIAKNENIPISGANYRYNEIAEELVSAGLMTVDDNNEPLSFSPDGVMLLSDDDVDPRSSIDSRRGKRTEELTSQADNLISAQTGSNINMMFASAINMMFDEMGGGAPDPRLPKIIKIFNYIGAVSSNLEATITQIDDSDIPEGVDLVEPDLP